MRQAINEYLPWVLSALTLSMTVLAGNKHPCAWLVGLVNQALWLVWVVSMAAWGLLPLTACLSVLYIRNHIKWQQARTQGA